MVECGQANAGRAYEALRAFDAPLDDLTVKDLTTPGTIFQIGLPPIRIDVMTRITGVEFGPAWADRLEPEIDGLRVPVIGRSALLANKRALGRTRDKADIELLESTSDAE